MAAISEEHFQAIITELAKSLKHYESKAIKHYQYADQVDNIFANYGISKSVFYAEANARLGIHTNETREKKRKAVKEPTKKVKKVKRVVAD